MAAAWPIMLSYVPIGLACGVLSAKVGIGPLWALLMSMTIMSGGAQFMIANLWLAGLPTLTIVASVCAISLRFALYSASLAPYLQRARKRTSLAMALTLIEEGYGVTLSKLSGGEKDWGFRHAVALNVVTAAAWFASVAAGAALGAVIDVPTAIASFAMTSLFTYLLWSQVEGGSRGNAAAAVAGAAVVVACKLVGWTEVAVPLAAVAGVAVALAATRGEAQARMAGAQDAAALRGDARRGGDAA